MEQTKKCSKCGIEKPLDYFSRQSIPLNKYKSACKACAKEYVIKTKEQRAQKRRIHYLANRERYLEKSKRDYQEQKEKGNRQRWYEQYKEKNRKAMLERSRQYRENNKDKIRAYFIKRQVEHPEHVRSIKRRWREKNHDKVLLRHKIYKMNNREKTARSARERKHRDPIYKLKSRISTSVYQALKYQGGTKQGRSFFRTIGYTVQQLKDHLERQFTPEMSWENYGKYWHVHHIIEKANFKYITMNEESFRQCWALSNLMPLDGKENQRLGCIFRNKLYSKAA